MNCWIKNGIRNQNLNLRNADDYYILNPRVDSFKNIPLHSFALEWNNLADEIKVDQKTISRIEKGELSPKFETLVSISKVLSINISQLLAFNESLIFNNYNQYQQGGNYNAYLNTEIDKVEELYKQLLKEKDEVIELLKAR
jgi:DNA-binding XRE family transcriptional regulator